MQLAALGALGLLAGCAPDGDGGPLLPLSPAFVEADDGTQPTESADLLYCPTSWRSEIKQKVGRSGGVVELNGHRITIPAGAVPETVEIRIRVRESSYLVVDIDASGLPSDEFLAPVQITLSYARCKELYPTPPVLTGWYLSPVTGEPLENMGGWADEATHSVTFYTDHLSAYALAN